MPNRIVRILSRSLALLLALSVAPVPVQAQVDATPMTFEVVSIKLHPPGTALYGRGFTDDGLSVYGMYPNALLFSYYAATRIEGIPENMAHEAYDIVAKVAEADIPAWQKLSLLQRQLVVRAMLEDRFKLKFHRETRPTPGYALVVAKGGPKFKEADPADKYEKGIKDMHGTAALTGVLMQTGPGTVIGQAVTMDKLAMLLSGPAQRPVLDKTGLTGKYDITMKYDPALDHRAPSVEDAVDIFAIVQEQLGLKLESGATVPVDVFVVDHMERPPQN